MVYKISVIIPVYNAEDTLESTIFSVINQSFGFKNIELIIVDDKSSDNSKKIISDFSKKFNNIKPIFLEKNNGPSIPRNIGIDHSTSDYLMFLDSDDEFVKDYCETMYSTITSGDFDICVCENYSKFMDGIYASSTIESKETEIVKDPFVLRHTLWGNIFKSSLIKDNNIKCPNTLCEDGVFGIKAFTKAKNIIYMRYYHGYIYTVESESNESVTHNVSKEDILSFIEGCYLMNDYLEENNLPKQRLINTLKMIFFMFFKIDASRKDKLMLLDKVYELEMNIGGDITITDSKPLDRLNNLILNKRFNLFLFISFFASKLYTNNKIKNFLFRKYSNFKKIDFKS